MKRKIKNRIFCLILIGFVAALFACGSNAPIKIGFIAGLSGRVADLGVAGRNGVMLAVEQKNALNGIHGHPIELIIRDDQQHPETAKLMVQDLLDQKVELIIGPMTSSMAMAAVPLVNKAGIDILSPTATTTKLVDTT